MSDKHKAEVEELKRDTEIRRALGQATQQKQPAHPPIQGGQKVWLVTNGLVLLAIAALYYLSRIGSFDILGLYLPAAQRISVGAMAILLVLIVLRVIKLYLIQPLENNAARFEQNGAPVEAAEAGLDESIRLDCRSRRAGARDSGARAQGPRAASAAG